jgi:transcriptional regulator with XRE-family HTH domain
MDAVPTTFQARLGARLRAVRVQQGLTLQQVETRSKGRWKAVVVSSYERGDRALSAGKLAALSEFYGVPITALLPPGGPEEEEPSAEAVKRITLDLRALTDIDADPRLQPVARFARTIQQRRDDHNGTVLSLRGRDVHALAAAYGLSPARLVALLSEAGVLIDPS